MNSKSIKKIKKQYDQLLKEITQLGFILSGTVTERVIIGKKGKKQISEKKYGPYYQWTRKVQGKTVTKNLSASQIKRYRKAIENSKKLEDTLQKMKQLSLEILEMETEGVSTRETKK